MRSRNQEKPDPVQAGMQMLQSLLGISEMSQQTAMKQQEFPLQMEALRAQIARGEAEAEQAPLKQEVVKSQLAGEDLRNVSEYGMMANVNPALKQMLLQKYPYLAEHFASPAERERKKFPDSGEVLNRAQALARVGGAAK
jgi:hypothetical protein